MVVVWVGECGGGGSTLDLRIPRLRAPRLFHGEHVKGVVAAVVACVCTANSVVGVHALESVYTTRPEPQQHPNTAPDSLSPHNSLSIYQKAKNSP